MTRQRGVVWNMIWGMVVISSMVVSLFGQKGIAQAGKYSKYSGAAVAWGSTMHADHTTPGGSIPYEGFSLRKYKAYYVGRTGKKVMYLTFDCGYENGYGRKVLDVLKRKHVKAIFFVTRDYIVSNPGIVKRMKREGHLVGNHTVTHPNLPTCTRKQLRAEVRGVEHAMKKYTGYRLDHYLRPPCGVYSVRTLKILKDLGYTTILWSIAYNDYDVQHQPGKQFVVDEFETYYHKGAIPLLHIVSLSDYQALGQVIKNMRGHGYRFSTMKHLP